MFDPKKIRKDFPILGRKMNGKPLVYLDSAATTQKPLSLINAVSDFYKTSNANVRRGLYELSELATKKYEDARASVAKFINAASPQEIVFTRNTTESINLIAYMLEGKIRKGDNIVTSELEHHSNLLPWHFLCKRKGAELKMIPVNKDGTLNLNNLSRIIDSHTKIVAVTQLSNVTGAITDLPKIIRAAKAEKALIVVDGAQGVPHLGIDVRKTDIDFLAFSAHKMLGPTGVGVLYGKLKHLHDLDPVFFGGEMVQAVDLDGITEWAEIPWKFEAGTPNIADAAAFKQSIEYIEKIGLKEIITNDRKLLQYARQKLKKIPGITIYGPENIKNATGVLSFNIKGIHPHDISEILNGDGIAIRAGYHCCQPLMKALDINGTARLSFYIYNTKDDIDRAVDSLKKACKIFK